MISVVILTLDEQAVLSGCLDSLHWCDDVLVFDSFSSDATPEIAKRNGARVMQREFTNYADQRSAALAQGGFKYPWVLMVDADERVPRDLAEEMQRAVAAAPDSVSLFRVRRKDMFLGKWIRRSSGYPTWFGRLLRQGHVKIRRGVNEEYHPLGDVGYLQGHLVHFPFDKGFGHWIERHNRYSSMEAKTLMAEVSKGVTFRQFFASDPAIRRKSQKQFMYRLPGRPLLVFLLLYLLRFGFLDGRAGLTFCMLRMIYEYMINLKILELKRRERTLPL